MKDPQSAETPDTKDRVLVEKQDLRIARVWPIQGLWYGIWAAVAGYFGTIYISLSLGFVNGDLVYSVAYLMAIYGVGRRWLLKWFLVGRRYWVVNLFGKIIMAELFWAIAFLIATAAPLFLTQNFFSRPIVQTLGLAYLSIGILYPLLNPLLPDKEAGLSLLQFLAPHPRMVLDFSFLRRGLRRVEKQLASFGVYLPKGTLALGASYGILNGVDLEQELHEIADWIRNQTKRTCSSIDTLLWLAKRAGETGMKRTRTWIDQVSSGWQVLPVMLTILNITYVVLALLGRIHP
jgi:hypothetical protein